MFKCKKTKNKGKIVSVLEKYFLEKFKLWNYIKREMPLGKNFNNYDEYWFFRRSNKNSTERAKIISKNIEHKLKILDIGCGDGTTINFIAKNNFPLKIVGIDISKEAINTTKKKGYEAFEMDVLSKDFELFLNNNEFDCVIITEVLEHIIDPEKVLTILDKFNYKAIYISIPNSGYYLHRIRLLLGQFPLVVIRIHIKEHTRFWTHKDFLYWCNYFGFKVIDFWSCKKLKRFGINLSDRCPSLFAEQIIYKIKKTNGNE